MPVKDQSSDTGSSTLLPMEMPGISNLAICRAAYEGQLGLLRQTVDKAVQLKGKTLDTVVNAKDTSQRTALHWACSNKHVAVVKYLVDECKADIKSLDDSNWTPLMIAASVGSGEIVDLLLAEMGSPSATRELVNLRNQTGQTALHYAASKNHLDVARALLDSGDADVNAADNYGNTPLHRAAGRGHLEMVKMLLATGKVNTSAFDSMGNTALHFACEEDHREIAVTLIQFGFALDRLNKEEKTPLDLSPEILRRYLQQNHVSPTA